jgi:hypothetical protein
MKLDIVRFEFSGKSTIGGLLIDNQFFCWTLEDPTRTGPKIPGETCISVGRYRVIIDDSERFKRPMPHVLDVPDFTGIRIHKGNSALDVRGCIAIGFERGPDKIWESGPAFDEFFDRLDAAINAGEEVWLTIREGAV